MWGPIINAFLVLAVVAFALAPAPLKPYLCPDFVTTVGVRYALADNGREYAHTTLYTGRGCGEKSLLVWFGGGGFYYSDRRSAYGLLNALSAALPDFDVLAFDHPVRFLHTVRESLLAVNAALASDNRRYRDYHAVGLSSGALLMGAFQTKETSAAAATATRVPTVGIRFASMVGVRGLYDARPDDPWFQFYVMRGTPGRQHYS